jgi:thiamine-phosphate pyrophosphorylase
VETEYFRESPRHLAKVNLKRLQESLRSLEEYSKLFSQLVPIRLEQLRYRTYTLEKMLSLGTESRDRLEGRWLYLLLSLSQCRGSLEWTIEEAVAGGVALIQLREKDATDREILERAKRVRKITRALGVPFILNDRPDLARLVEADGVHLGQDDLQVGEARKIVGREMMIGVSTHDLDQLRAAIRDGASYLGVGPTFPSSTKSFSDFAGLNFVAQASRETTLPWFAIGGINAETIDQAVGAGARRVAVSAAIAGSEDPRLAARVLREALEQSPG